MSTERRPHALRVAAVLTFVMAVVLGMLVVKPRLEHREVGTARTEVAIPAQPPEVSAPARETTPPPSSGLGEAYSELDNGVEARIGIAFAPVGDPESVQSLGSWTTGPAWSTIKVPLSIALLREESNAAVTGNMQAAITASDNGAAQAIWDELGAHQTAANKVAAVLADAGEQVEVQPEVTRPGFTAFGQTDWSLADQARFMAHAACDPASQPVLGLMGQIAGGQRWGLGQLDGARSKGGWGPSVSGPYLVRQLGLIPTARGDVAVAIAAVPNSGQFGDGTAVLNTMAAWVGDHLEDMPVGTCPPNG